MITWRTASTSFFPEAVTPAVINSHKVSYSVCAYSHTDLRISLFPGIGSSLYQDVGPFTPVLSTKGNDFWAPCGESVCMIALWNSCIELVYPMGILVSSTFPNSVGV